MSDARLVSVTIDCAEVAPVARFYEALLGMERVADDGDWAQLRDPAGGMTLNVQAEAGYVPPVWPEAPGDQQKMLHLEVLVDDLDAALVTALAAGGSEATWQPPDRDPSRIRIVLDPAGHPLCLFLDGE
jgi:catechol 2,3-dioxygenase-like lactoylglutathione lyase family enzyme